MEDRQAHMHDLTEFSLEDWVSSPTLQMRKLRLRKTKLFSGSHRS